jgi:hypothetical protein
MTKSKEAFMTIRLWVVVALAALTAIPAIALAGDDGGKAKSNAAKECKAERGTTDATRDAFAKKYGTEGSNYKNAFGKCVSQHAKAAAAKKKAAKKKAAKKKAAKANAAKECKAERGTTDATRDAFAKKYGTEGSNYKNAFGKCVSQHAKARLKAADHPKKPEKTNGSDGKGSP